MKNQKKLPVFMSLFLMGLLFSFTGCSAVTVKSASNADDARAKLFTPDSNRALVYVYRDNSFLGKNATANFVVGKKIVADVGPNQFSLVSMSPGTYDLGCASRDSNAGVSFLHNLKKAPLSLTAEAGQLYYVQVVFKSVGGFSLKFQSREQAEALLKKAKLAAQVQLP
jgi:hypothetical protein